VAAPRRNAAIAHALQVLLARAGRRISRGCEIARCERARDRGKLGVPGQPGSACRTMVSAAADAPY
jgi:hypothetical protein